jgi:hypothetical protein
MEIGHVTGIRAVSLLTMQRTESGLLPALEVAASARPGDDAYSSSRQTPDRGLEDEDAALTEEDEAELEAPVFSHPAGDRVSYFA